MYLSCSKLHIFFSVSPAGNLQDISPPVTPIAVPIQNSSPCIGTSPVINTRSPVLLAHQRSPNLKNQSPSHHNPQRHLTSHDSHSSTPPPPPPPVIPHTSASQTLPSGSTKGHHSEGLHQNSPQVNVLDSSTRLPEDSSLNGIHVLSQSQLHPLQKATLLQVSSCSLLESF